MAHCSRDGGGFLSGVRGCVEYIGNVASGYSMAGAGDGCEGFRGAGMLTGTGMVSGTGIVRGAGALRSCFVDGYLHRLSFRGCFWGWSCSGYICVEGSDVVSGSLGLFSLYFYNVAVRHC